MKSSTLLKSGTPGTSGIPLSSSLLSLLDDGLIPRASASEETRPLWSTSPSLDRSGELLDEPPDTRLLILLAVSLTDELTLLAVSLTLSLTLLLVSLTLSDTLLAVSLALLAASLTLSLTELAASLAESRIPPKTISGYLSSPPVREL